jgi:ankyrin repeat protein
VRDDHRTAIDQTHGYTALHGAAFHGNAEAARVLLRHGADPTVREDRYWGTPAGWAAYAGHVDVRDLILDGPIDLFEALLYDRPARVDEILAGDPGALERTIAHHVTGEGRSKAWLDAAWTPLAYAAVNGRLEAVHMLLARGADPDVRDSAGRTPADLAHAKGHPAVAEALASHSPADVPEETPPNLDRRVADFLLRACLDWRVSGSMRTTQAGDARRLLEREPAIARANLYTAVVSGELDEARRLLDSDPEAVSRLGGPRAWPPILYLCAARLPVAHAVDHAVEMLRLLLDRGGDPNAFYLGGNADIHYTVLTCVLGRGEELAPMHPRAREMAALLLERGADPHDGQVLYNVFADNTSRHLLDDDVVWLLDLMREHSVRRGHGADWKNPAWPMFDMRGAPSLGDDGRVHRGARFLLDAAVERNLLGMATWLLEHGAGPNTPPGELWRGRSRRTLYQEALARGHTAMAELLARHGAERTPARREGMDAFVDACLRLDRQLLEQTLAAHPEYLRDHRPMFAAIERDRADVVELLLDLGASPDTENVGHGGARALHMAAAKTAERCARLLIERGAEVDPRESSFGSTPIGWASYYGNPRMIELLGRHSRHVWTLTYRGLVERLREVLGDTPELARETNDEGQTPLFWLPDDEGAARTAAELLLEHGADPARRDRSGATAAEVAERRGLGEAAEVLRRAGPGHSR